MRDIRVAVRGLPRKKTSRKPVDMTIKDITEVLDWMTSADEFFRTVKPVSTSRTKATVSAHNETK